MMPLLYQRSSALLAAFLLLFTTGGVAQTIHLDLAFHANKLVTLVATHGIRKDTLQQITLDANGKGIFDLTRLKKQAGMVGLVIKTSSPPDATFDWLYSPTENPTIVGTGEYVHKQNARILNSPENQTLDRWYGSRYTLKKKHALANELAQFYHSTEAMYKTLQTEQQGFEKQLVLLADTIKRSPLFAATYMQFSVDLEQKIRGMWASDSTKKAAQQYFKSLEFDKLYATGLWFPTINGLAELYDKYNAAYHQHFGDDMVHNLHRTQNLDTYIALADAALSICNANSWHYDEQQLVGFLLNDHRLQQIPIEKLSSKLRKLAATYRVSVGKKAPDLLITKHVDMANGQQHIAEIMPTDQLSDHYTLLVFHESGCGNCDKVLTDLSTTYADWQHKHVNIVSMAADLDAPTFKQTATKLPWPDKYCDWQGFAGVNFKNYAIIGTPTLFLLDNTGTILVKTALLSEVRDAVKQPEQLTKQ
ncbi:redoxin domain-containing protein [Spirosoma sp. KCTC 42546]|uniref:TlpA family protein disulfide reductase n=1 Tax=Spirosoma sp. KCTC 42546 TaxID=2520506 RepID=UPI0011576DBA|nr:thioredoxin-like domain-containing protein [Spirosoma sp. KCTC 42546]QDK82143.1 redoxin domain-containing protein [Spirosoma sp. KCTC 42546]